MRVVSMLRKFRELYTTHTKVKEEVLETLDFDHFTTQQLASDVRKSGLYQADKIIERMEQLFLDKNSEFVTVSAKEKEIRKENDQLKKEKDQLKTDMKSVKSALDKRRYEFDGDLNPWKTYVGADLKLRYNFLYRLNERNA